MTKPIAMLRISDIEPLLSVLPMFEAAGYDVVLPDRRLRDALRDLGCRNVDEIDDMVVRWGAEPAPSSLREVSDLTECSLYVDVNGCHNGPLVWKRWPHLKDRALCYFINGGPPRCTEDKGDCITPATPIMTTDQHYRAEWCCTEPHERKETFSCRVPMHPRTGTSSFRPTHPARDGDGWLLCPHCGAALRPAPWTDKTYVFWPKFCRYDRVLPRAQGGYSGPASFVHNVMGWGGDVFVDALHRLGGKAYGGGSSPDGLVPHRDCFAILSTAVCTAYLKSGGAVDYSILEPMAAGCPVTLMKQYVDNTMTHDLLEPGVTCLTWGTEDELRDCVQRLRDPGYNRLIGEAGRERLKGLLWDDPQGFAAFLKRVFP